MALSRIAVIGGGILGLAVAREFTRRYPDAAVTVLEKEPRLAQHQTRGNAGIVDAGLTHEPGSMNARLAKEGAESLASFCRERGVPFEERGQLFVAQDTAEVDRLEGLFAQAHEAGIPVRMLDRKELTEVEPHARGVLALHSPTTGVTDFSRVAQAIGDEVFSAGSRILFGSEVTRIAAERGEVRLRTGLPGVESGMTEDAGAFDLVVACAGLQADRLAEAAGLAPEPRIVPFQGDYYALDRMQNDLVRGVISPVPVQGSARAGAEITRTVDGTVLVGPNVYPALGRGTGFDLGDLGSTLGHRGFWNLARRNVRGALGQARTTVSRGAFLEAAKAVVPQILVEGVRPGPKGIRAQALQTDGTLVDDLVVTTHGRITMVRAVPPASAGACLPLAALVVDAATRDH